MKDHTCACMGDSESPRYRYDTPPWQCHSIKIGAHGDAMNMSSNALGTATARYENVYYAPPKQMASNMGSMALTIGVVLNKHPRLDSVTVLSRSTCIGYIALCSYSDVKKRRSSTPAPPCPALPCLALPCPPCSKSFAVR